MVAISIQNPLDESVFPPEMPPVLFEWADPSAADRWRITVEFASKSNTIDCLVQERQWRPAPTLWADMKRLTLDAPAKLTIAGHQAPSPKRVVSLATTSFSTSRDEVGAPIFYREVNLPFAEAVKDPSQIRWRFGSISNPQPPPIVLQRLPVCGNCHSFSSDGQVMGMDVDYANSKASYIITKTGREMSFQPKEIITWDDFRRDDGELTFGLLSQVSPDGTRVVSTVKDKSVFVPRPDLAFSQLFFPIKGILAVYDRASRTYAPLPGADDPQYVQSNPVWSSDGRDVVFARAKAYDLKNMAGQGKVLLTPDECREFVQEGKPFRYDLFRVPYNQGQGGSPQPLEGASGNDQSNYFPRYSPDGQWIVFCRSANYMLLQPDSQLYIIPASGGEARRLRANTPRMNSWHSWSPNSRWLVFSSKARSPYTQLFLTHIDAAGESTPAVLLAHMTSPDRAANIPEFVNLSPDALARIDPQFLNDYSFERAGNEFYRAGDPDPAIAKYRQALELNPQNANAHQRLGFLLYNVKHLFGEGLDHTRKALELDPNHGFAHSDLAVALLNERQPERAVPHLEAALAAGRPSPERQYQPAVLRLSLGETYLQLAQYSKAITQFEAGLRLEPDNSTLHYRLALSLALRGDLEQCRTHYSRAVALDPAVDTSVRLHDALSLNYAKAGRVQDAIRSAERALELARASGKTDLTSTIAERLRHLKGLGR